MKVSHWYQWQRAILISLVGMILLAGCPTDPPPPEDKPSSITLRADLVSAKEVWLSVEFNETSPPLGFELRRDGALMTRVEDSTQVVLVIDSTVEQSRSYRYSAVRLHRTEEAASLTVQTLPVTSHAVQWVVDTLGAQGLIRDVWVFDENNAWAVGEIYLRDSTGEVDNATRYNGARWDGASWTLLRIPYIFQGQSFYNEMEGVFGLGESNIWFAGNGVIRWNGSQYVSMEIPSSVWGPYRMKKLWGTTTTMVIVGDGGSIARYQNGTWQKLESGTDVDLEDVWGVDENHVWATGTNTSTGHSVVMYFDGKVWSTIYDNENKPPASDFGFRTVWTSSPKVIYLSGQTLLRRMSLSTFSFGKEPTGLTFETYRVRGTGPNDVFVVAAGGESAHYGGADWLVYAQLKSLSQGTAFIYFYTVFPTDGFVLMGGELFTGLNGFPIVVRGYRF